MCYERCKLWQLAEETLVKNWNEVQECSLNTGAEEEAVLAYADISVRRSQFLYGRAHREEAIQVLGGFWEHFEHEFNSCAEKRFSTSTLSRLRLVAEEMIKLDAYGESTVILNKLRAWYLESSQQTSEEAILVSISLSKCLKHSKGGDDAELLLKALFDILMGDHEGSKATCHDQVSICIELAMIYKSSGRLSDAIDICTRSFQILWPPILDSHFQDNGMPAPPSEGTIRIAVLLASLYQCSDRVPESDVILRLLHKFYSTRFELLDVRGIGDV